MTQKTNSTSGLKKLLLFNQNQNQTQTKGRPSNIMKQEPVVRNSRRNKQDPVPIGKVAKTGRSHIIPGRKNNSEPTDLKPPEYVGVAKYTDEVRGSKSLTVERIPEDHPIPLKPKSNSGVVYPAQDCSDFTTTEPRKYGIFTVRPDLRNSSFSVLCEMEANGGGWTLLQRRYDGSISFNRSWNEYKRGFGHLDGEFWLGNDKIHLLTQAQEMVLHIQLEDIEGLKAYATYERFSVASELEHYRLTVDRYSGTAGDALNFSQTFNHDQKSFSTPDRDNDLYPSGNCGAYYSSGWWFDSCMSANLNGKYYKTRYKGVRNGIFWGTWPNISREHYPTNYRHAFKTVSMMIRPKSYKP
ncbi:fibroleukin-like [Clupea harengus]|uniref:Fibroleukin-like n=1 Tax=Clupea harengus TaxID=7950 RepID=A0A8M1KGV2_CLUHA|nr:fibroleukin-like [Clupea harengus]